MPHNAVVTLLLVLTTIMIAASMFIVLTSTLRSRYREKAKTIRRETRVRKR